MDTSGSLMKRIQLIHERILQLEESLAEIRHFNTRREESYVKEIALLHKQAFDIYSEIVQANSRFLNTHGE